MNGTNDRTVATYEIHAQDYIDRTIAETSDSFKAWIDDNLAFLSYESAIFEVGSGGGKDARYIESKGYTVQRSDAAQAFVCHLQGQGYAALAFNALTDDFTATYNFIFANAVVLHFTADETNLYCRKAYHALSPNGRLAFSVKRGVGEETERQKLAADRYFKYRNETDLELLVSKAGYREVHIREVADYRPDKPSWLLLSAIKGN